MDDHSTTKVLKTGTKNIKFNAFVRGDSLFIDIDNEQYILSLEKIAELEDLDKRTTATG